ncbi:MAG TPA: hypothetical protein VF190_01370 [Rhodothermales bacterium]
MPGFPAVAQPTQELAQSFRLDLAIPDAPAFLILEREGGEVLRPTSARAVATALSGFFGEDGGFVVPEELGVEVSPGLLIGGPNLSVAEYRQHPWLYRLRVSLASSRGTGGEVPTAVSLGIRVTTVDRADLRTSTTYEQEATALAEAINDLYVAERQRLGPTVPLEDIAALPHVQEGTHALVETFRERWSERRWNARIDELALAFRATAADSLVRNLRADRIAAWYTSAHPLGTWGQFIGAISAEAGKILLEDEYSLQGSLGSRFYAGSNAYRAYLEAQVSLREDDDVRWLVNGGAEVRLTDDLWIDFSAGLGLEPAPADSDEPGLFTSFRIGYGV